MNKEICILFYDIKYQLYQFIKMKRFLNKEIPICINYANYVNRLNIC